MVSFIYSTMFGNKSNNLLCLADNFRRRGLQCLLLLPECATKDGKGIIASRALNVKEEAELIKEKGRVYDVIMRFIKEHGKPDIVLIDECQFLSKAHVNEIMTISESLGIRFDCYGLRSSFTGEPFEGSTYLLAWAHNIRELETFNEHGVKNTMNILLVNGKKTKTGNPVQPKGSYTTGTWLDWLNK